MNAAQRLLYKHVPSFKQESGGLYRLYAAVYSWAYASRMRYIHRRGRHKTNRQGVCYWCGTWTGRTEATA